MSALYRFLEEGETSQAGDEYTTIRHPWTEIPESPFDPAPEFYDKGGRVIARRPVNGYVVDLDELDRVLRDACVRTATEPWRMNDFITHALERLSDAKVRAS